MSEQQQFPFQVPTKVVFGPGVLAQAGELCAPFGQRALIVTGQQSSKDSGALSRLQDVLFQAGITSDVWDQVTQNPACSLVDAGVARAKESGADFIIGLGGGSALDAAKAVAVLIANDAPAARYLGEGEPPQPGLPCVTVPTTAGSGAEVTNNAVLTDTDRRLKTSIRGDHLWPRLALVDPLLTLTVPPPLTASTGMDALTQHLEVLASIKANPVTDALALRGAELVFRYLPRAVENPDDLEARSNLSLASMTSGVALANSGLGVAHGLSHPLGALYDLPHGLLCAVLLPYVMEFNLEVAAPKYAQLAAAFHINPEGRSVEELAVAVHGAVCELSDRVGIPPSLRELGVQEDDLPWVAENALRGSTLKNPRTPTNEDLLLLLEEAF